MHTRIGKRQFSKSRAKKGGSKTGWDKTILRRKIYLKPKRHHNVERENMRTSQHETCTGDISKVVWQQAAHGLKLVSFKSRACYFLIVSLQVVGLVSSRFTPRHLISSLRGLAGELFAGLRKIRHDFFYFRFWFKALSTR